MVKRCMAAGCSNTYSDNVSLFTFPRDPALRQQWIKQVPRTRAKWSGPSEHSVLCSEHFDDECFEPDIQLASKFGLEKCKRVKGDAVSTIFSKPGKSPLQERETTRHPRKRMATDNTATSSQPPDSKATSTKRRAYFKREISSKTVTSLYYAFTI